MGNSGKEDELNLVERIEMYFLFSKLQPIYLMLQVSVGYSQLFTVPFFLLRLLSGY